MRRLLVRGSALAALLTAGVVVSCNDDAPTQPKPEELDPALVAAGREIFRFDTFGDEKYWTDTLRMHEVISSAVTPTAALSVGLKGDAEALPAAVRGAVAAGHVALGGAAAGLATTNSVGAGVLMLTFNVLRLEKYVSVHRDQWQPQLAYWRRILNIGLPAGGEFFVMFMTMALAMSRRNDVVYYGGGGCRGRSSFSWRASW